MARGQLGTAQFNEEHSVATEIRAGAASYLTTPVTQATFLTPERFDDEQRLMRETARTFAQREIFPQDEAIDNQEPGVMAGLVRKAGEQGLLMVDVPEAYGGAELGMVVSAIVASCSASSTAPPMWKTVSPNGVFSE